MKLLKLQQQLLFHYFVIPTNSANLLYVTIHQPTLLYINLSLSLFFSFSTGGETRTPSQWFWRPLLYQLSYTRLYSNRKAQCLPLLLIKLCFYSIIEVICPAPTVLPPSLIANLNPSVIATLFINSTVIVKLSPGITISVPSGN